MKPEANYISLKVSSVRRPQPDFCLISFKNDHSINYKPGQYLTLVFAAEHSEIRRSYSIVSVPGEDELLTIGVKRKPNGIVSRILVDQLKAGDRLLTIGAAGMFVLPESIENIQQLIFFAAGSGITPVYSLLRSALSRFPEIRIKLLYSNRSVNTTVFYGELLNLAEAFPQFELVLFFSDAVDINWSRLNREQLLHLLYHGLTDPVSSNLFYICGPESYMFRITAILQEQGIPAEQIRKENFIIPPLPSIVPEPPDKNSHEVEIIRSDSRYRIVVKFPDTILKAARKQGIVLPFSCETGRCGNCVAHCIKGGIWHSNNEVLTDADLSKGLILTCTGHPVFGDAIIKID